MDDRTLLELAAKAAGLNVAEAEWHESSGLVWVRRDFHRRYEERWNPLTSNADALWLMVKLRLCVEVVEGCTTIADVTWIEDPEEGEVDGVVHGDDPFEATRRAIVSAAAAIGKAMS